MSMSNALETDLLAWIFTGAADPLSGVTELDLHLHTADPGEAGASTTNEATYTSYAAVTVDRAATDWTVTGNTVTTDNLIQFPAATGGSNTITHLSITRQGDTEILFSGALSSSLSVSSGIQPQFGAGVLSVTLD